MGALDVGFAAASFSIPTLAFCYAWSVFVAALLLALAIVSRRLHFLIEDQVWNSCAQYKLHLYNCIEDHFITKIRCYSGEEAEEKKGYSLGGGGGVGVFHTKALPSAGDKLSGINH